MHIANVPLQRSDWAVSQMPGYDAPHTLLNVVRSRGPGRVTDAVLFDNLEAREGRQGHGGKVRGQNNHHAVINYKLRFLLQSVLFDENDDSDRFYRADDFDVGCSVWVGGRKLVIYDCDEATRTYYREVIGKGNECTSTCRGHVIVKMSHYGICFHSYGVSIEAH